MFDINNVACKLSLGDPQVNTFPVNIFGKFTCHSMQEKIEQLIKSFA